MVGEGVTDVSLERRDGLIDTRVQRVKEDRAQVEKEDVLRVDGVDWGKPNETAKYGKERRRNQEKPSTRRVLVVYALEQPEHERRDEKAHQATNGERRYCKKEGVESNKRPLLIEPMT